MLAMAIMVSIMAQEPYKWIQDPICSVCPFSPVSFPWTIISLFPFQLIVSE